MKFRVMFWLVLLFVAALCAPRTLDRYSYSSGLDDHERGDLVVGYKPKSGMNEINRGDGTKQAEVNKRGNDKHNDKNRHTLNAIPTLLDETKKGSYRKRDNISDRFIYVLKNSGNLYLVRKRTRHELEREKTESGETRSVVAQDEQSREGLTNNVKDIQSPYNKNGATKENRQGVVKGNLNTVDVNDNDNNVLDKALDSQSHMQGVLIKDGIEITESFLESKETLTNHLSHKYGASEPTINLNHMDKENLMNFIQTIFILSQRQNSKRTFYDDGDVRHLEEHPVGTLEQPLFHRYSNTMTLKDMYLKKGGVCTLITGFSSRPIYVISSCPQFGPPSNIQYYCENAIPYYNRFHQENIIDLIMTPVQDATGFVYKNVYCAQCNGINSIKAWSTKLDCDHFQSVELSDGRQQVRILDQFADKDEGCQRQLAPEISRMLHECSLSEVVSTMRLRNHELRIGEGSKSELSPFPLSFSLLMNFGFDGKTHILFTTQPENQISYNSHCDDNEQYDPDRDICRVISCGENYKLVQGTCEHVANYEADPTSGGLTSPEELDLPFRVTFTIRNASIWDLTTLYLLDIDGNLEELMQEFLSASFNISKNRVQNVTITIFNTSDADSQLSKEEIEIIFLSTTRNIPVRTSTIPTELIDLVNATEIVLDAELKDIIDYDTGDDAYDQADVPDYEADLEDDIDNDSTTHSILTSTEQNSTVVPKYKPMLYSNMSLNISFILYQPHRNRTHLEKSTKSVVKSMSELVSNNIFDISLNGTNLTIVGIYNVEDVQPMDKFCEYGHVTDYYTIGDEFVVITEYIPELNGSVTTVYINETGRTYLPGEYDLTYSVDGIMGMLNETIVDSFVFVCNMPEIANAQCSRIVLTPEEYVMVRDAADMFPPVVNFSGQIYNMSQFEWYNKVDRTIQICTPNWTYVSSSQAQQQWTLVCGDDLVKLVVAESYLTFILGLISLVCLFSVLVTYGIFEKLRNLPGINTVNLTLSLFLGELVFMISGWIQPHRWLCSAVGVLLHFLFLASFFWMNIMSYDVYCTFASSNTLGRIRSKKKYVVRYSAYAWGCPIVIVGICGIIDFTDIFNYVSIGYGGSFAQSALTGVHNSSQVTLNETLDGAAHLYSIGCWIQEPVASMAAFGGPMIFVLSSNTVMFIRTILAIRANKKSTKDSLRRSSINNNIGHDDVMLYVRMSTVMGFTWVFGLASSVVSAFLGTPNRASCIMLHLLGILFIVFNCSQGIFIFVVFILNRRVLALYKSLYHRLKHGRKKQVSISSSIGTIHSTLSQNSLNR